ncbi:MAG: GTPase [Pirellulales bacterium]
MCRQASQTSAVVLTPPGRGAVATVLVNGPGAIDCVQAHFRSASGAALRSIPTEAIVYGRWGSAGGEDLVICCHDDTHVEIHCHGGAAAVQAIMASLEQHGCQSVQWQDWLHRTSDDPLAAEARIDLASARTERTAGILLDQAQGALRRAIDRLAAHLQDGDRPAALSILQELSERAALGLHLIEPWRVVLAGQPNVGKSSLINALVGYERAIVDPRPGTTRDIVTATTALDGWPVELADTAGLRSNGDPIESAGIARAETLLNAADVVVLVLDASRPWSPRDESLLAAHARAVVVHNKSDLIDRPPTDRPDGIATSAVRGDGLDELIGAVGARLVPLPPADGAAVPFRPRHAEAIEAAMHSVNSGDLAAAAEHLKELTQNRKVGTARQ